MVFDTGGVGLMIDADLAEQARLPVVGTTHMSSPLGDPAGIEVPQARLSRLEVGGVALGEFLVDLWDGEALFRGEDRPRGVFGVTLLQDALVTIDFRKQHLVIESGVLPRTGAGIVILGDDQGLPVVPLDVAGTSLQAHLDTGNPGVLHLPFDLREKLPLHGPPMLAGRARTVDATVGVYKATLAGTVTVAGQPFNDLEVYFLEGSSWANVGLGLLRRFNVTLDLRNRLARFLPLDDQGSVSDDSQATCPSR